MTFSSQVFAEDTFGGGEDLDGCSKDGCECINDENNNGICDEDEGSAQEIDLTNGWSMWSTYIDPDNNDMTDIFADIIDDVIIIKDENGNPFWPEF